MITSKKINIASNASEKEFELRTKFFTLFKECPIPDNEILSNLGLFVNRQLLSRFLFLNELYLKAINTHGIIMDFGTRWGQNLALFESFRGIYEPYNHTRKIIGFDTFSGFPSVNGKDGNSDIVAKGAYSVTNNYDKYLQNVLDYHEQESPISHIKKYEIIKGDASKTIKEYLKNHPETIISFAYFDLDLYQPTIDCLNAIDEHLTKGSVIGFDQLNNSRFPGETRALKEYSSLKKYKIYHSNLTPVPSYIIID